MTVQKHSFETVLAEDSIMAVLTYPGEIQLELMDIFSNWHHLPLSHYGWHGGACRTQNILTNDGGDYVQI